VVTIAWQDKSPGDNAASKPGRRVDCRKRLLAARWTQVQKYVELPIAGSAQSRDDGRRPDSCHALGKGVSSWMLTVLTASPDC
jgi:hypothetical protein